MKEKLAKIREEILKQIDGEQKPQMDPADFSKTMYISDSFSESAAVRC